MEYDAGERELLRPWWRPADTRVASVGGAAAVTGFVFHFDVNGVDFVRIACGLVAGLAALVGMVLWLRMRPRSGMVANVLLFVVAVFHFGGGALPLLGTVSLGGLFGPSESRVRVELERSQHVRVTDMHRIGDGAFAFHASRGFQTCTGTTGRHESGGSHSSFTDMTCQLPTDLPTLTLACRASARGACTEACRHVRDAEPVDWATLRDLGAIGCRADERVACFYQGVGMEHTGQGGAALPLYDRGCELGHVDSCHNSAALRDVGEVVPADHPGAVRYWERACTLGAAQDCDDAAVAYDNGEGVPVDHDHARTLFDTGCERGAQSACTNLALLARDAGDAARALTLATSACDHDNLRGCRVEGELLVDATPPDAPAALVLFDRGCDAASPDRSSCTRAGNLLHTGAAGVPRDRTRAFARFSRGCEFEDALACRNAGVYLREGLAGERDRDHAEELRLRACRLGDEPSCR